MTLDEGQLEDEDAKLKKLLAETMLDNAVSKDLLKFVKPAVKKVSIVLLLGHLRRIEGARVEI
jgi:hypothetical protein